MTIPTELAVNSANDGLSYIGLKLWWAIGFTFDDTDAKGIKLHQYERDAKRCIDKDPRQWGE